MASAAECIGTFVVGIGVVCYSATFTHWFSGDQTPIIENRLPAPVVQDAMSEAEGRLRDASIARMIADGVFTQVNLAGNAPAVSTGPNWDGLPFEHRQVAVSEIAARYSNRATGLVLIQDGRTGQSIGTFSSPSGGLKLDR